VEDECMDSVSYGVCLLKAFYRLGQMVE